MSNRKNLVAIKVKEIWLERWLGVNIYEHQSQLNFHCHFSKDGSLKHGLAVFKYTALTESYSMA